MAQAAIAKPLDRFQSKRGDRPIPRLSPLPDFQTSLCCHGWGEPVAAADRRYLQVQVGVLRMTAFVNNLQVSLVARANADEDICLMVLSEVRAQTALSVVNRFHLCSSLVIIMERVRNRSLKA